MRHRSSPCAAGRKQPPSCCRLKSRRRSSTKTALRPTSTFSSSSPQQKFRGERGRTPQRPLGGSALAPRFDCRMAVNRWCTYGRCGAISLCVSCDQCRYRWVCPGVGACELWPCDASRGVEPCGTPWSALTVGAWTSMPSRARSAAYSPSAPRRACSPSRGALVAVVPRAPGRRCSSVPSTGAPARRDAVQSPVDRPLKVRLFQPERPRSTPWRPRSWPRPGLTGGVWKCAAPWFFLLA
jgi:hypothetical protein